MGRPHALADPEFAKQVAEAFAAGMSRNQMCDLFNIKDPDTITRWRRDPRVKAPAMKIIEDRVLQVTRKVDGVIAERLEHANEMSIDELLKIRKEFLGGALRAQTEKADDETIAEAQDWLEKNPDKAEELEKLFEEGPPGTNIAVDGAPVKPSDAARSAIPPQFVDARKSAAPVEE